MGVGDEMQVGYHYNTLCIISGPSFKNWFHCIRIDNYIVIRSYKYTFLIHANQQSANILLTLLSRLMLEPTCASYSQGSDDRNGIKSLWITLAFLERGELTEKLEQGDWMHWERVDCVHSNWTNTLFSQAGIASSDILPGFTISYSNYLKWVWRIQII